MTRRSVVIIGGGISGLSAAFELSGGAAGPTSDTPRIELLEANERCGGSLATTSFAGRSLDLGADGFLARRPEVVQLAADLQISDQLVPIDAAGASIYLRGRLDELPTGLVLGVPTRAAQLRNVAGLSRGARFAAWRDEHWPRPLSVDGDVSIGAILRAKMGDELTDAFIEPMIGGIQAGRVDELSAQAVFPALWKAAAAGGSLMQQLGAASPAPDPSVSSTPVFYSLRDGVGSLTRTLVNELRRRGVIVRTGTPVTAVRRAPAGLYAFEVDTADTCTPANTVVVATPAAVTARLLGTFDPHLDALATVPTAGAAMVTFRLPKTTPLPAHGTGILVPLKTPFESDSFLITAVTFLDRKWPHLRRDDDTVLRVHVGRSDDTRWCSFDDDALVTRTSDELARLIGTPITPLESLVQRWPHGLPQYLVGHGELVANAQRAATTLGVALCGNVYDGVGVPASVGSGRRAGAWALQHLRSDS